MSRVAPEVHTVPPSRPDRPDRPDRADQPKPSDDRGSDTKAAQDNADAKDAKAADAAAGDTTAKDTKAADTNDGKAANPADAADKPKADAEQAAALDALLAAAAATPPVAVPQAAVVAVAQPLALAAASHADGAPEADALAALQAATQGAAPNAAPKPGQAEGRADKHADADVKGATRPDPQTAVPQIDSGKDGQARGNGDKSAGEFRHAAAELLAKLGADAPAQQGGDAAGAAKAGTDAVQNLGVATPANTVATAVNPLNATAGAAAPAVAIPLAGLAVEITAQAHAGNNHFEIRLDPPELGRIDVKLNVDRDGNISTHVIADRSDTLDLLKRDASTLERALQQAGLKTSDNGLEFSLRQQAFTQDDTAAQSAARIVISDDDPAPLEAMRQGYGRLLGLGGGLDIRV